MSSKKRLDKVAVLRYKGKALRMWMGIIPDPEIARQIAEAQTNNWKKGIEPYLVIRDITRSVMDSKNTFVPMSSRAPYYAFIQEYYKSVVVGKIDADKTFDYLLKKYPDVEIDKIKIILKTVAHSIGELGQSFPLPCL